MTPPPAPALRAFPQRVLVPHAISRSVVRSSAGVLSCSSMTRSMYLVLIAALCTIFASAETAGIPSKPTSEHVDERLSKLVHRTGSIIQESHEQPSGAGKVPGLYEATALEEIVDTQSKDATELVLRAGD